MSKVVLDASVLLAIMLEEPGWKELLGYLSDGVMSSVNMAEVQTRLVKSGLAAEAAWSSATFLVAEILDFDAEQGRIAGDLALISEPQGLSLGDRACLALAKTLGLTAITTDRVWANVNAGIAVTVVR